MKIGLTRNTLCQGHEKVIHSTVYDWSCHRRLSCWCFHKFRYKLFGTCISV